MAKKRTVNQIFNETLPGQSKDIYKKKWDEFQAFFGGNKLKPEEADYITYFDHLHNHRGQKASSKWTTYSMLTYSVLITCLKTVGKLECFFFIYIYTHTYIHTLSM